jgi:hypothetical protein
LTAMTELHVIPDERTSTWRVYRSDAPAPLSQHGSATAAELAALEWAEETGAERIFVHDCYHRTREAAAFTAALRALSAARRSSSRT